MPIRLAAKLAARRSGRSPCAGVAHGLRRFPESFALEGKLVSLRIPDGVTGEIPSVEPMLTQGTLAWSSGTRLDCPCLEAAQYAAALLSLGWARSVEVPGDRKLAVRARDELQGYVKACQEQFEREIGEASDGEAQAKRVRQMFLGALGKAMFEK